MFGLDKVYILCERIYTAVCNQNIRLDRLEAAQRSVLTQLSTIMKGENKMSASLDALTAQVTQNTSVEESAVVLINGIAAQLAAAGTDPAALKALQDSLTQSANDLGTAITANTPAATP